MKNKNLLILVFLIGTLQVFSQTEAPDIIANTLSVNDSNTTTDWGTLWQSGFYQSQDAANAPGGERGWFWGLNMNHSSNNVDYKYNGQLAIKNNHTNPTMYFRSTYKNGNGTWAKVLHDQGDQTINGALTANKINLFNNEEGAVIGYLNAETDTMSLHSNADGLSLSSRSELSISTNDFRLNSADQSFTGEEFRVSASDEVNFNGAGSFTIDTESRINLSTNDDVHINAGGRVDILSEAYFKDNVGIGTINPEAKLHVNGDLKMNIGEGFKLYGNSDYFGTHLDGIIFEMQDSNATNGITDGGFVFKGYTPTDGISKEWMTIKSGGKVGIGTAEPEAKLNIVNSQTIGWSDVSKASILLGTSTTGIGLDNNEIAAKGTDLYFGTTTNHDIFFRTGAAINRMFIDGDTGKVGIGTTTPKNELSVNGTIWAKNVKVRLTDAADWVFEDNYSLRSLAEVKAFINKNKHLPEIPSAEEFRKNDMEVADMTNKLLQKIEELTLYTIDQEEQLKAQAEKLQKMEVLEARLNKLEALLTK